MVRVAVSDVEREVARFLAAASAISQTTCFLRMNATALTAAVTGTGVVVVDIWVIWNSMDDRWVNVKGWPSRQRSLEVRNFSALVVSITSLGRAMMSSAEVGLRVVFLVFGALGGVVVRVGGCVLGGPVPAPAVVFPGGILVL